MVGIQLAFWMFIFSGPTVDGRNPATPGMVKTLWIMGSINSTLVLGRVNGRWLRMTKKTMVYWAFLLSKSFTFTNLLFRKSPKTVPQKTAGSPDSCPKKPYTSYILGGFLHVNQPTVFKKNAEKKPVETQENRPITRAVSPSSGLRCRWRWRRLDLKRWFHLFGYWIL